MAILSLAVLVIGVTVAGIADVRTRRIPNALTGTLAVAAVASSVPFGWWSVFLTIALMSFVFVAGTFAFSLRLFGGGDVKLLVACCGLAGIHGAATLMFYTFLAGGIVAIVEACRARRLSSVLVGTVRIATHGVTPARATTVPYGLAIAIGSIAYALSVSAFPALRFPL